MKFLHFFLLTFIVLLDLNGAEMYLKDNFKKAHPGDFIVTSQNKTYTLLHIYAKTPQTLTIEEITVPDKKMGKYSSWREWIEMNAPGHTAWVMYKIDLPTGTMSDYYSFSRNSWYDIPEADNFLSTLLNLRLTKIQESDRKRVGPQPGVIGHDRRAVWQPRMVMDGQEIDGVAFDAWKTYWPNDGSELAGKTIEVYLPQLDETYPSYFPYWLQISGKIGKAKVRIIDSGTDLVSPRPSLEWIKSKG